MRYYKIELQNARSGAPITPPSLAGSGMPPGTITSLLPDGSTNPAALNIEFDLVQYYGHQGGGDMNSYIRIWGLSLAELAYSFPLNGQTIRIYGGMAKGYPLADPAQQGLLVSGQIFAAFGNWIGTDQTLDIIVQAPIGNPADQSSDQPVTQANFSFTWAQGETLAAMIARVLSAAMPNSQQQVKISTQRISRQNQVGVYQTFSEFAGAIQAMTVGTLSPSDKGVLMTNNGGTIAVFEGSPSTPSKNTKQIKFQDLLGQVTWAAPQQITAKMVLRGDLDISDTIQFPPNVLVTTTAGARPGGGGTQLGSNPSSSVTFGGEAKFQIQTIQHWGNFRQPDAQSWNTVIWATPITPDGVPTS
jgi:hypothetical protein